MARAKGEERAREAEREASERSERSERAQSGAIAYEAVHAAGLPRSPARGGCRARVRHHASRGRRCCGAPPRGQPHRGERASPRGIRPQQKLPPRACVRLRAALPPNRCAAAPLARRRTCSSSAARRRGRGSGACPAGPSSWERPQATRQGASSRRPPTRPPNTSPVASNHCSRRDASSAMQVARARDLPCRPYPSPASPPLPQEECALGGGAVRWSRPRA